MIFFFSIFCSCCLSFLSNPEEGKLIKEASYRTKLVQGIADGYESWLFTRDSAPAPGPGLTIPPSGLPAANAEKAGEGEAEH